MYICQVGKDPVMGNVVIMIPGFIKRKQASCVHFLYHIINMKSN